MVQQLRAGDSGLRRAVHRCAGPALPNAVRQPKRNSRMNAEKFRSIVLAIPGAVEASHMSHPDFRLRGKIFATLGYPDDEHGMVKLTPEQQRTFRKKAPSVFAPCAGMWGKRGATSVHLPALDVTLLRAAVAAAVENVGAK